MAIVRGVPNYRIFTVSKLFFDTGGYFEISSFEISQELAIHILIFEPSFEKISLKVCVLSVASAY